MRRCASKCARHATSLRRALVDRARLGRELLAGLEPALSAARQRGLQVEIQVVGDPGLPSREAAQATLAAVDTVLQALPAAAGHADRARPVGAGPDATRAAEPPVELYLTFGELPPGARAPVFPPVTGSSRWRAALDVDEAGAGCLEIGWRPVVPA